MKKLFSVILLAALLALPSTGLTKGQLQEALEKTPGIIVLCYHDTGLYKSINTTPYTVEKSHLENNIQYLLKEGYKFLSLDDFIAINKGERPAPSKAVMLTFDDGYLSFYTEVFPLLKKYNVPAMMAIIGSWMDNKASTGIKMSSWEQFREMEKSGLVTIASHTYDLHKPVLRNAEGQQGAAVGTRIYRNGRYETEAAYIERLKYDFAKAQKQMEENLGHKAKALVWPFGEHNDISIALAKEAGFEATFILSDGSSPVSERSVERAKRIIVSHNVQGKHFPDFIEAFLRKDINKFRYAQIKISDIYVPADPEQTDANIDMLVNRLINSNTWRVALQVFSDENADGTADQVYFYNRQAPIKTDLINHIAGRLLAEGVQVYAWMPALSNSWLAGDKVASAGGTNPAKVSPFDKNARKKVVECFKELAIYVPISGVYFADDLFLAQGEDLSPAAQAAYKEKFGRLLDPESMSGAEKQQWIEWKTQTLIDLTNDIMKEVKAYRPEARSVRFIRPEVVLEPAQEEFYAENYEKFLQNYDYIIIKAYDYDAQHYASKEAWLAALGAKSMQPKYASESVILQLSIYDKKTGVWYKPSEIQHWTDVLAKTGVQLFDYTPETLLDDDRWYFPNIKGESNF